MTLRFLLVCLLFLHVCFFSSGHLKAQASETPLPCLNKSFGIAVHIVRDSSGSPNVSLNTIRQDIDSLNNYFAPICVSFSVARVNYIDNFNYDSLNEKKDLPEMQVKHYFSNLINMYFVEGVENEDGICGKATLGGIANTGSFIYILKNCIGPGNYTIIHEMGHYFGLFHTFEESGDELADGSNCETRGDQICDTPADPFREDDDQSEYIRNCRFISPKKDANGDFYNASVSNVMSYYKGCECGFTNGQYRKMAETYLNSSQINW